MLGLGYLRARRKPRFPYMANPLPDAEYAMLAARPGWQSRRLKVARGIELRALLREPATARGPWIMYCSGNSPHLLRESQQFIDAICAEPGWGGAVWAYRGFDSSGGAPRPAVLAADACKAYTQLLRERGVRPDAVHIVGYSLGTSIAAAVAAQAGRNRPASLALLAPMTRLFIGERLQPWLHRYETTRWLPRVSCPTLIVHGAEDATLGVDNGRAVARALGARASLVELPGVGHLELPVTSAAQQAVRDFISQHAGEHTG